MDQIQRSRRNAIIKRDAILAGIGILYYIFIRITGFAIPCIFRKLTGLRCPGCGLTRAVLRLARLDLAGAFSCNQFIFIALPAVAYIIISSDYRYVKSNSRSLSVFGNVLTVVCIVGAVLFAVLRNILQI